MTWVIAMSLSSMRGGEIVERSPVARGDDEIADRLAWKGYLAADEVVDHKVATWGNAKTDCRRFVFAACRAFLV